MRPVTIETMVFGNGSVYVCIQQLEYDQLPDYDRDIAVVYRTRSHIAGEMVMLMLSIGKDHVYVSLD